MWMRLWIRGKDIETKRENVNVFHYLCKQFDGGHLRLDKLRMPTMVVFSVSRTVPTMCPNGTVASPERWISAAIAAQRRTAPTNVFGTVRSRGRMQKKNSAGGRAAA
jgi:hypothetical protein